jgi:glycosyltransferase involved in cell wall biosynthesis
MRILTFTHLFPNELQPVWGIFVYQRVVHFFKRSENNVQVVAPVPYIPRWFPSKRLGKYKNIPPEEVVGGLAVEHPRYPLFPKIAMPFHGILLFLGCYRKMVKLHREQGFDCIDSHWIYPDGFAAVLIGKRLGVPVFCSARGTDINVYPTMPIIRPIIQWTLRRAAGVIAGSGALKQEIMKLGIPAEKIRVIGNGVDVSRFAPMDRQKAREQLGLPSRGQLAVAVGSLSEHKNHAMLISAAAELSLRWPELRLCIIGEGPQRPYLEKLAAERGMAQRVQFPGNQPNELLNVWYNADDVSCLPSTREGWPNVLLESLGSGTPIVATRVGGVHEVIVSAEHGVLVEPNAAALAEGLDRALNKKWDRHEMVRYARSRTWNEVAAEMEQFFKEVLRSQSS